MMSCKGEDRTRENNKKGRRKNRSSSDSEYYKDFKVHKQRGPSEVFEKGTLVSEILCETLSVLYNETVTKYLKI